MSNRSSRTPHQIRLDRFKTDAHFAAKAEKSEKKPNPNLILAAKHMIPFPKLCKNAKVEMTSGGQINTDYANERRMKSAYCQGCADRRK